MISLEKRMILTPLLKLPNNEGDLGNWVIVSTGFECLPKKQKIAKSWHTAAHLLWLNHGLVKLPPSECSLCRLHVYLISNS